MNIELKLDKNELRKRLDIKDGKDGKDGRGIDGKDGKDGLDGKDADEKKMVQDIVAKIPSIVTLDTPEEIREKLESLEGDERLDKTAIKGLAEALKETSKATKLVVAGGGRNAVEYTDLSANLNGSLKAFTVPRRRFILLVASFFPYVLRPTVDYTGDGTTTLTLTSEIPAPPTGQTLILLHSRI